MRGARFTAKLCVAQLDLATKELKVDVMDFLYDYWHERDRSPGDAHCIDEIAKAERERRGLTESDVYGRVKVHFVAVYRCRRLSKSVGKP